MVHMHKNKYTNLASHHVVSRSFQNNADKKGLVIYEPLVHSQDNNTLTRSAKLFLANCQHRLIAQRFQQVEFLSGDSQTARLGFIGIKHADDFFVDG